MDGHLLYQGGNLKPQHGLDVDRVGYLDLVDQVEKMGYTLKKMCYRVPWIPMFAMREIKDDKEVMEMVQHVMKKKQKVIEVYIEGNKVAAEGGGREGNPVGDTSDTDEDFEFNPIEDSDTEDDSMDDDELSDDEEYMEARKNLTDFKKMKNKTIVDDDVIVQVSPAAVPKTMSNLKKAVTEGDCVSDYGDSSGDVKSLDSSEEDEMLSSTGSSRWKKESKVIYDSKCDHNSLELKIGMRFENIAQCKAAVQRVAILCGRNMNVLRSSRKQLQVTCVHGCPFRLYASVIHSENNVAIKSLVNEHMCSREMRNRQATSNWLADEYMHKFKLNPNWSALELKDDAMDTYTLDVDRSKCYRAKHLALNKLRGTVAEHYGQLRQYCAELLRVDSQGRFEFLLDDHGQLEGFFIGFSGLKQGFLAGCRPIIGLDGCFLKTFLGGTLLTAVAKDGNNQMFPICWAVAATENEFYWKWFINILMQELNMVDGFGWTFMSDQQKGLTAAIKSLAHFAEHRNCARHVYCNWKKEFKGQTLKGCFWKAANCTNPAALQHALAEMKEVDEAAYNNFVERETHRFCKAYISDVPKSDMINNNVTETFNGYIVKARAKHIIDMLEDIRCALMIRMYEKYTDACSLRERLCP